MSNVPHPPLETRTYDRLLAEPLRHVVTLKMLHLAGTAAQCQ